MPAIEIFNAVAVAFCAFMGEYSKVYVYHVIAGLLAIALVITMDSNLMRIAAIAFSAFQFAKVYSKLKVI